MLLTDFLEKVRQCPDEMVDEAQRHRLYVDYGLGDNWTVLSSLTSNEILPLIKELEFEKSDKKFPEGTTQWNRGDIMVQVMDGFFMKGLSYSFPEHVGFQRGHYTSSVVFHPTNGTIDFVSAIAQANDELCHRLMEMECAICLPNAYKGKFPVDSSRIVYHPKEPVFSV